MQYPVVPVHAEGNDGQKVLPIHSAHAATVTACAYKMFDHPLVYIFHYKGKIFTVDVRCGVNNMLGPQTISHVKLDMRHKASDDRVGLRGHE